MKPSRTPADPYFPPDWPDDEAWEVFHPDGDPTETDPLFGDFWIEDDPPQGECLAA